MLVTLRTENKVNYTQGNISWKLPTSARQMYLLRIIIIKKRKWFVEKCMYINQQDAQISVINFIVPLDALNVSDYISPSSGATL